MLKQHAAILALLLTSQASTASEMAGGRRSETTGSGQSSTQTSSPFSSQDSEAIVIDGREIKPQVPFLPSVQKLQPEICKSSGANSLCSKWTEAEASYSAAAQSLGVPAQVLMCLTYSESGMVAGQTSSAGAKGLTQFMPATARDFERKFGQTSEYQKAWASYKELGGTKRNSSAFTADNIQSTSLSDSDVQIFATSLYFRDVLKSTEDYWKNEVGEPPNVNRKNLKRLYHTLMVSYNAGPGVGEKYIKGTTTFSELPKETQGYLKKFNKCMGFKDDPAKPDNTNSTLAAPSELDGYYSLNTQASSRSQQI